jgi:L-lactate dehydrogenase complex protein LldF
MGSVLTPLMTGLEGSYALPNASTLCGRCAEVCPMSIPLPELLRKHRDRAHAERLTPARTRWPLQAWAALAARPRLYRPLMAIGVRLLRLLGARRGRFSWLPMAGGWTHARDLAAPQGATFQSQWRARRAQGR